MYESSSSNCFVEISPFSELKYASSNGNEPARKKRCGLTAFSEIAKGPTQTSGTFEAMEKSSTSTFITLATETMRDSLLASIADMKVSSVCKQKKESDNGSTESPVSGAEEVLGSVTTFYPAGHPENGHTLRTSARVKHKMRMETIHNNPMPGERKDASKLSGVALTKTPNPKQMRVVWSNHDKNLFFEALNEYGKDFESILTYLNTKKRRKDNASEQQVFKIKDVRNLYYQFNQKISKYLHFSDEVRKEAQELYALINYGEMRKKVPFQNKKYFQKLKDLVYKGFTMVREKGKTIRIKTPSCRALRKLNQLEEWQEEIKLPPRVDVFLQPANMDAWGRVQAQAQNPRVRITVAIQKRVTSLLQFFQHKWRPQELRLIERVEKMKTISASVTSKLMRQRMQNEIRFCSQLLPPPAEPSSSSSDTGQLLNLQLHFAPSPSAIIHRPLISLAEFQSNTSICLNSYEQRIGVKVRGETLALPEKPVGTTCRKSKPCHDATKDDKQAGDQMSNISMNEFLKSPNASNESIELKELDCLDSDLTNGHGGRSGDDCDGSATDHDYITGDAHSLTSAVQPDPSVTPMSDNSNDEFPLLNDDVPIKYEMEHLSMHMGGEDDTVKGESMLHESSTFTSCITSITTTSTSTVVRKKCTRRKGSEPVKPSSGLFNHLRPLVSEEEMQRIRDGWTVNNVGDLTFGDLYIMFGEDMKLHLEYDWVWEEVSVRSVELTETAVFPTQTPAEQHPKEEEAVRVTPPTGQEDGTADGDAACTGVKEEPPLATELDGRYEVNVIGKRLKQLLLLMNMNNKNGKKKCLMCRNNVERKPKRNDGDNNLSTGPDDNLIFKQPMLPPRIGINFMPTEPMHITPLAKYKQSRWWRTRINRQQGHYPPLPIPRTPHAATDTLSFDTTDSISIPASEGIPAAGGVTGKDEKDPQLAVHSLSELDEPSLSAPRKGPVLYEEENASDIGDGKKFPLAHESYTDRGEPTNPKSSSAAPSVGGLPGASNVAPLANAGSLHDGAHTPTTVTTCTASVALSARVTLTADLQQNDDSCLSLFDLSLPSTSSSLMANIFSTTASENDDETGRQAGALVDTKILDTALNDISLSSFFGQLDAVYQSEQAAHQRNQVAPETNFDLDLPALSESSVDYIARFESIASELRAQGNP